MSILIELFQNYYVKIAIRTCIILIIASMKPHNKPTTKNIIKYIAILLVNPNFLKCFLRRLNIEITTLYYLYLPTTCNITTTLC